MAVNLSPGNIYLYKYFGLFLTGLLIYPLSFGSKCLPTLKIQAPTRWSPNCCSVLKKVRCTCPSILLPPLSNIPPQYLLPILSVESWELSLLCGCYIADICRGMYTCTYIFIMVRNFFYVSKYCLNTAIMETWKGVRWCNSLWNQWKPILNIGKILIYLHRSILACSNSLYRSTKIIKTWIWELSYPVIEYRIQFQVRAIPNTILD